MQLEGGIIMKELRFEKDNVLTALSEINHQLEELETKLGESFSDLRCQGYRAENKTYRR